MLQVSQFRQIVAPVSIPTGEFPDMRQMAATVIPVIGLIVDIAYTLLARRLGSDARERHCSQVKSKPRGRAAQPRLRLRRALRLYGGSRTARWRWGLKSFATNSQGKSVTYQNRGHQRAHAYPPVRISKRATLLSSGCCQLPMLSRKRPLFFRGCCEVGCDTIAMFGLSRVE